MATLTLVPPFVRPRPPKHLVDVAVSDGVFVPAPEVWAWIHAAFLHPDSPFFLEDHVHLRMADVGILWTNVENHRQMRTVVGTAEMPNTRGSAWQKARAEQQLRQWFGVIPDFIITLLAPYAAVANDSSFCALVDHELFHCAQAIDEFGNPRFHRDSGEPIFAMKGHDSEEFVGVIRRWGVGAVSEGTRQLIEAAKEAPQFSNDAVAAACGTCLAKVA